MNTPWGIHGGEDYEPISNGNTIAVAEPTAVAVVTPYTKLLEKAAESSNLSIFEKAMELEERWHKTQARRAFDHAMSQAKAEMPVVTKNQLVDFEAKDGGRRTNYQYEDFADVVEAIQPVLSRHGLYLRHTGSNDVSTGMVHVTCILGHQGGFREETPLNTKIDTSGNKNHIQAIGSAITYLQRYSAKLALGLAAARDDDGQGAGGRGGPGNGGKQERRPPSKRDDAKTIDATAEAAPYVPQPSEGPPFALPTKRNGVGRDPWEWGEDFKATLRQAEGAAEIGVWLQLNQNALGQLSKAYPEVRASIDECVNNLISGGGATKAERKPPSAADETDSDQWRKDMIGALSACESDEEIKKVGAAIDAAPDGILKEHLTAVGDEFKRTVDRVLGIK
jgi:hypothetical protein